MTRKMMSVWIDLSELRAKLLYDPVTGLFTWRRNGRQAGHFNKTNGYVEIRVNRRAYYAHRLAWVMFYSCGKWPAAIDHINGNRADNRIENLRVATVQENNRNTPRRSDNKSGFKGVCKIFGRKKWTSYIKIAGKVRYLGSFETPEAAHAKYCEVGRAAYGEFFNDGATA